MHDTPASGNALSDPAADVYILPVSFAQQRLFVLDQLWPGLAHYNLAAAVRLTGPLDVIALRRSLNEIVRRHEALRTTFELLDGEVCQVIAISLTIEAPLIDLSVLPEHERNERAKRVAEEEAQRPFDLSQGPLLRCALLRLSGQEHIFLLTMHHIVSDGWSMGIFTREMGVLYEAFSTGRPSPLSDLPIQYADFAQWQRQWLQGEVLEDQLSYWRKQLAAAPTALEMPIDRPRSSHRAFRGAMHSLELSSSLIRQLKALSQREGATLFMTLLAAFQILLHRLTGQDDIVVGSPIAGRNKSQTDGLIGFFVNTVVLRATLAGNPEFQEHLRQVREMTLEAYAHQDLPFEKLVEELHPERDSTRPPLFQVFFNMLNFPSESIELAGLTVEILSTLEVGSKFDLTLYVKEEQDRITLEVLYDSDLFERSRIAEMFEQLNCLLSQIADNPNERVSDFSLVTQGSRLIVPDAGQLLRSEWAGAAHEHFSAQSGRASNRLAVVDKTAEWTYEELEARSNQMAHCLIADGIGSQDIVAIYGHRSASLVWALLGVLKAGAAFTILDPVYPDSRLIDCLNIAAPKGWVQIEEAGALPAAVGEHVANMPLRSRLNLPALSVAAKRGLLANYSTEPTGIVVRADDLAYVSFTSGSTGKPKAIAGTHRPLTHFLQWHSQTFGLNESDRFAMLSGLSHDPLLRDVFTPLYLGATLSIPDPNRMGSSGWLAKYMERERITVTHLTPSMGHVLARARSESNGSVEKRQALSSLRYAFFGGETLTRTDVAKLKEAAPSVTCVNFYGATETPQAMGYFIVHPEKAGNEHSSTSGEVIPLGAGIEGVQLLILNSSHRLAGIGEVGEIYVRTPYLAKYYLGDDALTRARFIANPLTNSAGDRVYKTGDLGRYLPDGNVEFVGRTDSQVKVRGYRVELEEIAAVLRQHVDVEEAVILSHEVVSGEKGLLGYVTAKQGRAIDVTKLRSHLRERLPEYMVPQAIVELETMPLTPNGKLDRNGLPPPSYATGVSNVDNELPRTPVEEVLAGLWGKLLGVEQVGVFDDFFDVGGHSLLATQLVSRLRSVFQVEIPLRSLFDGPTVAELAQLIETAQRDYSIEQQPGIERVARDQRLPLSYAQQRLWFLDQLEPGSAFYNIPAAVRLVGRLDEGALERSLNEVVRRHETLRTNFVESSSGVEQMIAAELKIKLSVKDLRQTAEADREAVAMRLAREEAGKGFNLAEGALLRAELIRMSEQEQIVMLSMHHIVSDGWSAGVLIREVAELYEAYSRGEEPPLEELRIQYVDYAVWQRKWLSGGVLEAQLGYWKEQLKGAHFLELSTDRPRPEIQTHRGVRTTFKLPEMLTRALTARRRLEDASLFMLLLAAFQVVLRHYTGLNDIVVGTDAANRNRVEIEGLIGFFVNQLALRTDLSNNPSFRELLGRTRNTTIAAYAREDVPFDKVVEALQLQRSSRYSPLFQVKITLQNTAVHSFEIDGITITPVEIHPGTSQLDLIVNMVNTGDELSAAVEYNTDLFDGSTISELMRHFETVLETVATNPEIHLDALVEMLAEADSKRDLLKRQQIKESRREERNRVRRRASAVSP